MFSPEKKGKPLRWSLSNPSTGSLKRIRMSDDVHWITVRVGEAQKLHTSVTEAVSTRVEELLKGQLSKRRLRQTELTTVAMLLIAEMVPSPPKAEVDE
jgi:hypothetical protein